MKGGGIQLQPLKGAGSVSQAQEASRSNVHGEPEGLQSSGPAPCRPWEEVWVASCRKPWQDVHFGKIILTAEWRAHEWRSGESHDQGHFLSQRTFRLTLSWNLHPIPE